MFAFGIIIALATLILDQFSKYWLIQTYALHLREPVEMTSFFNLVVVWNTGISFGMFSSLGINNAHMLIIFAALLTTVLLVWLWRTSDSFLARGIGLVIGGAIGNIIDRIHFGAVFDFIDIHAYGWHWPALNIADMAICIGVVIILIDGFLCDRSSPSLP